MHDMVDSLHAPHISMPRLLSTGLCTLAVLALALPGRSQTVPTPSRTSATSADCEIGSVRTTLSSLSVSAYLSNAGMLFWPGIGPSRYTVNGATTMYNLSLWLGGDVDGQPRFSGAPYTVGEFWPGPLDESGATDAARCAAYDRIWVVKAEDLESYRTSGIASPDVREWPIGYGAPFFVDANDNAKLDPGVEALIELTPADPGYGTRTIDLAAGERPAVLSAAGTRSAEGRVAFWILNDVGNEHVWSGQQGLGVEVHVSAYALTSPSFAVQDATFYRHTVVNRSPEPITDFRLSFFADPDIGASSDDYVASDPDRGMLVGYNANESASYAVGLDLLTGASGAIPFDVNAVTGDRLSAVQNAQRNRWIDGTPITRGGDGYNPGQTDVTSWIYDGDPVTSGFWTEENIDGSGSSQTPGERAVVLNTPSTTLGPGETTTVDLAILYGFGGSAGRMGGIQGVRFGSDTIQNAYDFGGLAALQDGPFTVAAEPESSLDRSALEVHPSPVRGGSRVPFTLPSPGPVRLRVVDVLGREVTTLAEGVYGVGPHDVWFDASSLPAGVYVLVLDTDGQRVARTVTVAR